MTEKTNEIVKAMGDVLRDLARKHQALADTYDSAYLTLIQSTISSKAPAEPNKLAPEPKQEAVAQERVAEPGAELKPVSVEAVAALCVSYTQGDKSKAAEIRAKLSEFGSTRLSQLTNDKLAAMEDWLKAKLGV